MNLPAVLLVGGVAISYLVVVLSTAAKPRRERELPLDPVEPLIPLWDVPREHRDTDAPSPDVDLPDGGSAE